MAPPAWPMYMPSYMPRPPTQLPFLQDQFEELPRQHQDIEVRELEVQCMSRTHNLNAVRDARGQLPLSEEASALVKRNRHLDVQVPSWHLRDPRPLQGLPLQGSRSSVRACLRLLRPLLVLRLGQARMWRLWYRT